MISKKIAVFGMDLEEWYHLDYVKNISENDRNYSMLDGLNNFFEITEQNDIKATIFTVAEIANKVRKELQWSDSKSYDIASHGLTHTRPLTLSLSDFINEIKRSKLILEEIIQKKIIGFRAPCFSIDAKLLDVLMNNGYLYDSSKIDFKYHRLYGNFQLNNFIKKNNNVYIKDIFLEFEIPTSKLFNKQVPFSGGGYLRLFPQKIIEFFIKQMENEKKSIFFYLHPFELSQKTLPILNLGFKNNIRMKIGRRNLLKKIDLIIKYLKKNNWKIMTFREYYESIVIK